MAERLGRGLQSPVQRFDSARRLLLFLLVLLVLVFVAGAVYASGANASLYGIARRALLALAALSAASGVYLAVYVAGEDDYRADGTSRWDAYDAHGLTIAAVVVALTVALFAALLAVDPQRRLLPLTGLAGILAVGLLFYAYLANSLN